MNVVRFLKWAAKLLCLFAVIAVVAIGTLKETVKKPAVKAGGQCPPSAPKCNLGPDPLIIHR